MCIIAVQPIGVPRLPDDILADMWEDNCHGGGYMFCEGGKLIIRKAYFDFATFLADYVSDFARCASSSPFVIHFRFATHGSESEVNTHPHCIKPGRIGMVHNGILPLTPPRHEDISDTVFFARTVLAYRPENQLMGKRYRRHLAEIVGASNKLVLMSARGEMSIVNEDEGEWIGGVWFSNLNWMNARQDYADEADSLWEMDDAKWEQWKIEHEADMRMDYRLFA